ncbi:hypothetical protein [Allocoleopsis sp.]|uniref:hypothetical protein n=1 Tax=Allocoleopsis sp. TaxID=3088169 RepID=UPI002FD214A5
MPSLSKELLKALLNVTKTSYDAGRTFCNSWAAVRLSRTYGGNPPITDSLPENVVLKVLPQTDFRNIWLAYQLSTGEPTLLVQTKNNWNFLN